jgi:flavin reductase (DIM6/NTAB) family NADH-FMN oxidoreductase RutF
MSDTAVVLPFAPPVDVLDDPGLSARDCRAFYRGLASGVTVVTAGSEQGPVGSTASSVTSVSLHPPLLLACLATGSRTTAAIRTRRSFAVNLLAEDQRHVSDAFAAPVARPEHRFAGHRRREVLGVPVLTDTLAWAVCLLTDIRRYGDHDVVVGRLVAAHTRSARPLLWHDRGYHRIRARVHRADAAADPA